MSYSNWLLGWDVTQGVVKCVDHWDITDCFILIAIKVLTQTSIIGSFVFSHIISLKGINCFKQCLQKENIMTFSFLIRPYYVNILTFLIY